MSGRHFHHLSETPAGRLKEGLSLRTASIGGISHALFFYEKKKLLKHGTKRLDYVKTKSAYNGGNPNLVHIEDIKSYTSQQKMYIVYSKVFSIVIEQSLILV